MKSFAALAVFLILTATWREAVCGGNGNPVEDYSVDGVVGFSPVSETTYLALHFAFGGGWALSGFLWYNNDEDVTIPRVLVAAGNVDDPGPIGEAFEVMSGLNGETLDWSAIEFDVPVASSTSGLYVIMELPVGSDFNGQGFGGGFGIGYREGPTGVAGWVTADGDDWVGLQTGYRYAVQPNLVEIEPGMIVLSADNPGMLIESDGPEVPDNLKERGLIGAPNPFNPAVTLWYYVATAGVVRLGVYDLRGMRVRVLVNEEKVVGAHSVVWRGDDDRGSRVASGVYFVVLRSGSEVRVERFTLVK